MEHILQYQGSSIARRVRKDDLGEDENGIRVVGLLLSDQAFAGARRNFGVWRNLRLWGLMD